MKIKYLPLDYRELNIPEYEKRVLFFDPKEIYERVNIDPFKRRNGRPTLLFFPEKETCACGCGKEIGEGRSFFHNDECNYFAELVRAVISGRVIVIKHLLEQYHGKLICAMCAKQNEWILDENEIWRSTLQLDHIIPICEGGGGCWLNNYQLLCHRCHALKNKKEDRERKEQMYLSKIKTHANLYSKIVNPALRFKLSPKTKKQ